VSNYKPIHCGINAALAIANFEIALIASALVPGILHDPAPVAIVISHAADAMATN
jgi:hypothetical protein